MTGDARDGVADDVELPSGDLEIGANPNIYMTYIRARVAPGLPSFLYYLVDISY